MKALLLALLAWLVPAAVLADPLADADRARLVTEDIARFWHAWDLAAQAPSRDERVRIFDSEYLAKGSAGLQAFSRLRIGDADQLVAAIDRHPRYYAQLRARSLDLDAHTASIRTALRKMATLYPDAVFPDVYFVIGRMNSGGTLDGTGLLIGLEMFGRGPDTPLDELGDWHRAVVGAMDKLPHIVAHEWVHFQQRYPDSGAPTLLAMALGEGIADFIAELGSGRHINHHIHDWAEPRATELWREFAQVMHGKDAAGWVYGGQSAGGRPADLGYWIGYRVARAHYQRSADKTAAIRQMLTIADFDAFLANSGAIDEFTTGAASPSPH